MHFGIHASGMGPTTTSRHTKVEVTQSAARTIDRKLRRNPGVPLPRNGGITEQRICAMIASACYMLNSGAPKVRSDKLHRLDKVDTMSGLESLKALAVLGVPYSVLLYERFLGRPFASHRDSISELVGRIVEDAIENILSHARISYRKTGSVPGLDQAPDFSHPQMSSILRSPIEAKLTEDDGTARDKVTRVQHLASLSMQGQPPDQPKFELVACIAGRVIWRPPRRYEEATSCDARKGVYSPE